MTAECWASNNIIINGAAFESALLSFFFLYKVMKSTFQFQVCFSFWSCVIFNDFLNDVTMIIMVQLFTGSQYHFERNNRLNIKSCHVIELYQIINQEIEYPKRHTTKAKPKLFKIFEKSYQFPTRNFVQRVTGLKIEISRTMVDEKNSSHKSETLKHFQ